MTRELKVHYFDWLKYQKVYLLISGFLVVLGIFSLTKWGLNLGLEFTGGTVVDYKVEDRAKVEELRHKFEERQIEIEQIQESPGRVSIKTDSLDEEKQKETSLIADEVGVEKLQLQSVGPSVGPELIKKTVVAILIAASVILFWVAAQFKKLAFGAAAILATLHDSFVLVGSFSLFGHFFGAQVDFLFVTAVLTTLSFSVHDTIVVFDRIREISKKHGGEINDVVNRAVSETMRRSLINSLTIIIMLLALVVFGGETIRWFAVALLVGAVCGTYSSPFVAVPLYVNFERLRRRFRRR